MQTPICGNGIVESGEECGEPGLTCPPEEPVCIDCMCQAPVCGNGTVESGEACDDGNTIDGDGCNSCQLPYCGNGIVDPGEACDDGNTVNEDACRNDCTLPSCGDGIVDPDEACDDGNTVNEDACRNNCTLAYCGDGIVDPGEACEEGLVPCQEGYTCEGCQCEKIPVCGDGVLDSGEECDVGFACLAIRPFCWGCQCVLAVDLASFNATGLDGSVKIDWSTGNEVDNLGFYVQRSDTEGGPYTRINSSIILAQGGVSWGADYTYTDTNVENGRTYWYKLEDVDRYQGSTLHGPVSATPGASTSSTWEWLPRLEHLRWSNRNRLLSTICLVVQGYHFCSSQCGWGLLPIGANVRELVLQHRL